MAHYCIRCGTQLVARTIEGRELEACPNDDFVLWRDPKVSAAVVVEAGGGIVLGRRAIEPGYGLWCLPGGFINDDEDPAEAAMRECREEICVEVAITGLIGVYHVPKQDASSIIAIAYRARVAGDEAGPSPGDEMLEVRVFPLDALPPLAFPSHRRILRELFAGAAAAPPETQPSAGPAPRRSPRRR